MVLQYIKMLIVWCNAHVYAAQVLTEVCDNGSIFDLYSKQNTTFKRSTAWRLARECAGWHIYTQLYSSYNVIVAQFI